MLHSENLHKIFLLLIIPASIFLFYPSFGYYFFQDDWFVLNWVQNSDLLSLLSMRTDVIYWRPISMPGFFKAASLVFDLNPYFFHLSSFIFHLVNSALIYFLARQLKFTKLIAAFIAFLYATAAFHFIPLSWLSTTSYVIGPTFVLSALIFFLKNKFAISFVFFLLGLASSELTLTMIPMAFLLSSKFKKTIFSLLPFIITSIVYLAARFVIFPLPQRGEYELLLTPKVATNVFWYFAANFNMPEAISTVFYFTKLKGSIASALDFWQYLILPIFLMILNAVIVFAAKISVKQLVTAIGLFLAGLSPVILLPFHFYPMYIVLASLGVFYALASSLAKLKSWQTPAIVIFALSWFIASALTISFTRTNHWIANLQSISKAYVDQTKNLAKNPPSGSTFLFRYPTAQFSQKHGITIVRNEQNISQALNNQDAMQVIYRDKTAKSFYETDSHIPQIESEKLFAIWPRE